MGRWGSRMPSLSLREKRRREFWQGSRKSNRFEGGEEGQRISGWESHSSPYHLGGAGIHRQHPK